MAFVGDVVLDNGITINYHIISEYNWQKFDNVRVIVDSYVNKAMRDSGKSAVYRVGYEIVLSEEDIVSDIDIAFLYGKLALKDEFINLNSDVL